MTEGNHKHAMSSSFLLKDRHLKTTCNEFKVYLPAVYKQLTDLQQMANLWFQSSSLR